MDFGTVIAVILGGIASIAVLAVVAYMGFLILKTIIMVPLVLVGAGAARQRHRLEIDEDPRITGTNAETERLQPMIAAAHRYVPQPATIKTAPPAQYRSILGFIPAAKVPGLEDPEDFDFFAGSRRQEGHFTVHQLVPNQLVSSKPDLRDLGAIMRPRVATIEEARKVMDVEIAYPVAPPPQPAKEDMPNFGQLPKAYEVPPPVLKLDGRPIETRALSVFQKSAFEATITRYDRLFRAWDDLRDEHQELLGKLRDTYVALKRRLDLANAESQSRWQAAMKDYWLGEEAWNEARDKELTLLRDLALDFSTAYNDDPAKLAMLALDFLVMPRWLPTTRSASVDPETGILIIEQEFPDVGRIDWMKDVTTATKTVEKPATKAEAKDANERLYPALSLRYAYEVARVSDPAKVNTIVINGWADYIDRTTGETKRAFVSSLLAKLDHLSNLNLPQLDVIQAFNALKGVTARAQTVTPVAPIVRINTDDRRFVDAKAVLDDVGDQNLATMDWGDFEHLCRELFEREFATSGAEVKITQASRDQGVDAVIFDPHPIRGGKIVIQAKRYAGTVDVSAVRDLWGTTQHEGAMKGILVTTSSFGSDAYNFIAGKPLTLINGGELLQILESHGYKFRIDLAEAKKMARERYSGVKADG